MEIDLPDPEIVTLPILIESVVRRTLGRPEGDILATEVARFTALDASGIDLHSLSGLGSFVNLRRFYLADNRLEDISPLLILDNLESVNLMRNPLNQASINDVIPRLKARGVEVIFEAPPVEKPAEPVPVKPEPPPSPVTPPPAPVPPPTPVVPPPAPVPPPAEPAGGSGAGAAVGGALGGLLVIGGVVFWWLRRRPRGGGEDGPGYTYRGR